MKEYKWLLLLVPFLGLILALDDQTEFKNTLGKKISDFVFGVYQGYWLSFPINYVISFFLDGSA